MTDTPSRDVDPTQNVMNLVDAANKRQDDLRAASEQSISNLVAAHTEIDRLVAAHLHQIMALRAEHEGALRRAERDRIDAIRSLDVASSTQAAETGRAQAAVLANQVAESAEALRVQVEATRQQTAIALDTALQPLRLDVADLRRVQYEQQGVQAAKVETKTGTHWTVSTAVAVVAVIMSIVFGGITLANTGSPAKTILCQGTPMVCK